VLRDAKGKTLASKFHPRACQAIFAVRLALDVKQMPGKLGTDCIDHEQKFGDQRLTSATMCCQMKNPKHVRHEATRHDTTNGKPTGSQGKEECSAMAAVGSR